MDKQAYRTFPKLAMSCLPTPLHKLQKISNTYGAEVYCKRDDLTGFGFGGNKTRKLDYLIADAKAKGADAIITVGSNQSNFCRIAAAAGKVNDLDVYLLLGGKEPKKPTGNLLLVHLFGAKIHHLNTDDRDYWEQAAEKLEKKLKGEGKKTYRLPFGGSVPTGVLGYVDAFFEILEDCKKLNISFEVIIHASGSGGTQAGLVVGQALTDWPGKIIGISVAEPAVKFFPFVYNLSLQTADLFKLSIKKDKIFIDDSYLGEKYGAKTEAAEQAIEIFAGQEGILLDSVYTGKAASALINYCQQGKFKNKKILFLHTGGNIELFE